MQTLVMQLTKNSVGRAELVSIEVRKVVDVAASDRRRCCHCYKTNIHLDLNIDHNIQEE